MEIPLTQGKVAIIDDEDYDLISQYKWCAHWNGTRWYAISATGGHRVRMHRLLIDVPEGYEVDHINGDSLDNRKQNLRVVTRAKNLQNREANKNSTSKYIGVYLESGTGKFRAALKKNGITYRGGRYKTEEEAAKARDILALQHFGQDCKLNFPEDYY
ncbi:MAG TPA: HNH endonuclease [Nitrososphaera sp.]|jgi:hypothetical protein